eukprot:gene3464-13523_t
MGLIQVAGNQPVQPASTPETMLNARTLRQWLINQLGKEAIPKHMVAVSTNLKLVKEFGIDPANAFGFWDWVGGRYSVCSAVGILPLALQYGFDVAEEFLAGANNIDDHFKNMPIESNLPVILGLLSVWNSSFLGYPARAILPYCQYGFDVAEEFLAGSNNIDDHFENMPIESILLA